MDPVTKVSIKEVNVVYKTFKRKVKVDSYVFNVILQINKLNEAA